MTWRNPLPYNTEKPRETTMARLLALICTAVLALTACSGSTTSGPKSLRMTVWTANQAHLTL
ncbi:hypothetical protein ADL03_06300, partial [Nocardia sp. NRRL S-836]